MISLISFRRFADFVKAFAVACVAGARRGRGWVKSGELERTEGSAQEGGGGVVATPSSCSSLGFRAFARVPLSLPLLAPATQASGN